MRESTPSSTTLAQPTSNRARLGGGDNQLALTVTPKPTKLDRGRDSDDDMLRNKKPKSHGFGTAQLSEITDSGKKMRADPGGVASPLALPPSTAGIERPPVQLSRKQHATTASQFAQITNDEAADDDL